MKVDVIIPVCKPDVKLQRLIDRLLRQTVLPERIDIIHTVMTGGLTNEQLRNTISTYLRVHKPNGYLKVPIVIHGIREMDYDHGATRHFGTTFGHSDCFIMMTQDAVPVDARLLERLLEAVMKPKVCVAYSRQVASASTSTTEKLTRGFNYPMLSRIMSFKDIPDYGIKTFFISDVCAMYDRKCYEALGGFEKKVIFNEDMLYAYKAIQKGYSTAYVAEAAVCHSHNYSDLSQFRRSFDLGVSHAQNPSVFDNIGAEGEGMKYLHDVTGRLLQLHHFSEALHFPVTCMIRYIGFFLGRHYERLPERLVRSFSMNKNFWKRLHS